MSNKERGTVEVMTEPEVLVYQDYDLPIPERGAILLKVLRSNVCGSELHIWRGGLKLIMPGSHNKGKSNCFSLLYYMPEM